ncbi:hypothetical protein TDB9533_02765 [Thalassocella blandensis]|nr:hypothetical protein TDB9533_02765 [Thalassocella blandensis]
MGNKSSMYVFYPPNKTQPIVLMLHLNDLKAPFTNTSQAQLSQAYLFYQGKSLTTDTNQPAQYE